MSKSLGHSLSILEYVINQGGTAVTPSELAKELGYYAPTCIRILNGLVANGYIVEKSRREGYIPGPAVFALSGNDCFYKQIIRASEQVIKKIALKLRRMVLISTYRGGRKFILNHYDGVSNSAHLLGSSYNDLYHTVSGRVLLAHLSDMELDEYIKANGMPCELWGGMDSPEALRKELEKIRQQDHMIFDDNGKYLGICLPVWDEPFTVISSSVLEENDQAGALALLQDAAMHISETMKQESPTAY